MKPKWPSCGIQILVESCRMPLDCGSTMQCLRIVGACLFKKLPRSTSSPHPSHRGFLSSPPSSRRSRTSPLQETHLQQSPIMSRDLSYGCCHAAAHITKHCRTLPCLADYVRRRWLWMSRRRSGGRLEFQVIQVAPWFVGMGGPLLGATDGGGLEQAQQQQWGAAATKTCICGT